MDLSYCSPFLDKSLGPSVRGKCDPRHMNCVIITVQLIVLPAGCCSRCRRLEKLRGRSFSLQCEQTLRFSTPHFLDFSVLFQMDQLRPFCVCSCLQNLPYCRQNPVKPCQMLRELENRLTDTDSLSVENQHHFSVRLKLVLRLKIPYPTSHPSHPQSIFI